MYQDISFVLQGVEEPHPGIAPPGPGESLTYHKYYQWVIFFFFVQGVMFYLPRLFWKHAEGGLMKNLVGGLTDPLIPYQVIKRNIIIINIDYKSTLQSCRRKRGFLRS